MAKRPAEPAEIQTVQDLKPDKKNPNKGTDRGRQTVRKSLEELGAGRSVVVDRNGQLIAGNKTATAARELGLPVQVVKTKGDTLVVVQREDLDLDQDERARRLSYADNRAAQLGLEWDPAALIRDAEGGIKLDGLFSEKELAKFRKKIQTSAAPLLNPDNLNEPETYPQRAKRGQIWKLGRHRLMVGDSRSQEAVQSLLGPIDAPHVLLTDPPYSSGGYQESGRSAGSVGMRDHHAIHNDKLSTRGYQNLMKEVLGNFRARLVYAFTDWKMWTTLWDAVEAQGYGVRTMAVWDKETPGMGVGWRNQHELVMAAFQGDSPFDPSKALGNVLRCSRVPTQKRFHPTEKPVELLRTILQVQLPSLTTVADPFAGSGSTLLAAEKEGLTAYGMELEPTNVDIALGRWELVTGIPAELLQDA